MKKIILSSILASLVMAGAANAQVTSNFNSNANLNGFCTISAQDMAFGNINFITAGQIFTANGSLSVLCSNGISYKITPDGSVGQGSYQVMYGTEGNTDGLRYVINKVGGVSMWSNGTNPMYHITGVGSGELVSHAISARIEREYTPQTNDPAITNVYNYQAKPGNYVGTMHVTLTY